MCAMMRRSSPNGSRPDPAGSVGASRPIGSVAVPGVNGPAPEVGARPLGRRALRFIDLFAGLGGFHLALRRFGHRAVFACELNPTLRELYEKNFGLRPAGDIRDTDVTDIPPHDVLCAG